MSGCPELDAKLDRILKHRHPGVMSTLLACKRNPEAGNKLKGLRRGEIHRILREGNPDAFALLQLGDTGYQQLTYDGSLHPALERACLQETEHFSWRGSLPQPPVPLFQSADYLEPEVRRARYSTDAYRKAKRKLELLYPEADSRATFTKKVLECGVVLGVEREGLEATLQSIAKASADTDTQEHHRSATGYLTTERQRSNSGLATIPQGLVVHAPHVDLSEYLRLRKLTWAVESARRQLVFGDGQGRRKRIHEHICTKGLSCVPTVDSPDVLRGSSKVPGVSAAASGSVGIRRNVSIASTCRPEVHSPESQASGMAHLRRLFFAEKMGNLLDVPFDFGGMITIRQLLIQPRQLDTVFGRDDAEDCIDALRSHLAKAAAQTPHAHALHTDAQKMQQASDAL